MHLQMLQLLLAHGVVTERHEREARHDAISHACSLCDSSDSSDACSLCDSKGHHLRGRHRVHTSVPCAHGCWTPRCNRGAIEVLHLGVQQS